MNFSSAVVNTSFLTASLCFVVAWSNAYLAWHGWGKRPSTLSAIAWFVFGLCYLFTQFGPEWFKTNQRAFFRVAVDLVLGTQIYSLASMYAAIRPLIKAGRNNGITRHPDDSQ